MQISTMQGPTTPVDVLYVDDDANLRQNVCDLLREEGFSVGEAPHGEAALDYIAAGHRPSLVFLDLDMPVMDGAQCLARLRKNPITSDIPVVLVSGLVVSGVLAGPEGVLHRLSKPVLMETLIAFVRRFSSRVS
jgi:CheY-like chemotaxis protein